jgi:cell division septation protein DedD
MPTKLQDMAAQARTLIERAAKGDKEAGDQALALMDVMSDVSGESGVKPIDAQPVAVPASMPGGASSAPSTLAQADAPSSPSTASTAAPESSVPTTATTPAAKGTNIMDNVATSNPPEALGFPMIGPSPDSFVKSHVPEFISIMERGDDVNRLQKAYKRVAQEDQFAFTDLWNAA